MEGFSVAAMEECGGRLEEEVALEGGAGREGHGRRGEGAGEKVDVVGGVLPARAGRGDADGADIQEVRMKPGMRMQAKRGLSLYCQS